MFTVIVKSEIDEDICLLIKVANHSYNYICDCGEAKNLTVKECQQTKAIFISHTHIDHFVNFDTILRHQIGTEQKVIICGPAGITNQIQNRIKSYCWNLIEPGAITYEIREITSNNTYTTTVLSPPLWQQEQTEHHENSTAIFIEKEFSVAFEILDHKTPSIAYLFKGEDKTKINIRKEFKGGKWAAELKQAFEYNKPETLVTIDNTTYKAEQLFDMITVETGKKVGIILDHAAIEANHDKIKNTFTNCDEVYIECFYKDEDKEAAIKNYHSYASMSGNLMKVCNVKEATPIHFSRKYAPEDIKELIAQFMLAYKE